MSLVYNAALLLLSVITLPKLLFDWAVHKKYRGALMAKLGFVRFNQFSKKSIWMHAVSMGEVRAMAALFAQIKKAYPDVPLIVSTTTQTGLAEAKRSCAQANYHFMLPLDFSWNMKRLVAALNPSHLILCESDFWYNLLCFAKKKGAKISLVNGKISSTSYRRFFQVRFFAKKLFSFFDSLCMQNQDYADRMAYLGVPKNKLFVTGNLKLEAPLKLMSQEEKEQFCTKLHIEPQDRVLVIASTHEPEEEILLDELWKIPRLKVLLVPRHPERFDSVAQMLEKKGICYQRLSKAQATPMQLTLIDTMGQLIFCYQVAHLAIVAGSYIERVGGHNIFEPVQQGIPVFFGPYMQAQKDLKELILSSHTGKEVQINALATEVTSFFESSQTQESYRQACRALIKNVKGSVAQTFEVLFSDSKQEHQN